MHTGCAVAVVVLSATLFAQSTPPSCPADRPVDDLIAEVEKQQSKKKHRNTNPFPEVACIWGRCRYSSRTPPTVPEPAPRAETPSNNDGSSSSESSSRTGPSEVPVNECDDAMEMALRAAQNVDVGDFYFAKQNYRAALLRYQDAVAEKPGDAAIHVRLARVFEKLKEIPQAIEQYKAAQKLGGPEKWTKEAGAALLRLQASPSS